MQPYNFVERCHFTYPFQWLIAMRPGPLDAISVGFTSCSRNGKEKKIQSCELKTPCNIKVQLWFSSIMQNTSCKRSNYCINEQLHNPKIKHQLQGFTVFTYTGCELCGSWTWPFQHYVIWKQENTIDNVIVTLLYLIPSLAKVT